MCIMRSLLLHSAVVVYASAFIAPESKSRLFLTHRPTTPVASSLSDNFERSVRIYRESSAEGAGFKQIIANVLAGDYDTSSVNTEINGHIDSAPCVMFIWESSPSCKSAILSMKKTGADIKLIRLDDPWDEGNKLRAELGKRTGKTSVPSIWIGGEYVGGYDSGTGEESPGVIDLAFRGVLVKKLQSAGAIKAEI